MNRQDISNTDVDIDRARIDGGFSFALAALILGLALLALLQRIGIPENMLRVGVIALIFSGLVVVAARLRTMRPIDFYAGSHKLPGTYAGLAFAGLVLGLFLPFLPPQQPGISFGSVVVGFAIGCIWAAFATGPVLRRSGASSVADFITSRFPHIIVRVPIVLLMSFCAASVALGGYEVALESLTNATGVDRGLGAALLGGLLIVLIIPAGLSSVVWVTAGATVVLATALGLPLCIDLLSGIPLALPVIGDQAQWTQAAAHFWALTGSATQAGFQPTLIFAIGLGFASLAPIFGATMATRDEGAAWRGGFVGTIWLALGALLITATIAASTLAIVDGARGRLPSALPPTVLAASGAGNVGICGFYASDATALAQVCAAEFGAKQPLHMHDITADGLSLLESLPMLRGAEPTLARLAAAFMIVLGIGVAASGVQFLVTALTHDVFHPRRRRFSPASQRLAMSRLMTILVIGAASFWLASHGVDVQVAFTLALMLSAALVSPLLALAVIPRPTSISAFASLCVGTFLTAHFLLFHAAARPPSQFATDAIFAAFDGLAVGLFIAFLPKRQEKAKADSGTPP